MNRKGGISLPILIGLVIISLVFATGAFYLYQKENAKNAQLQDQIEELNTKQKFTENQLSDAKKLATDLQLKLQESKAQIETLTSDLSQEKLTRLEISSKFDQMSADLDQQKLLRQDLENRLSQSESNAKIIKDQLKVINQEKSDLQLKIKNLEEGSAGVELGKVVVNTDKAAAGASTKKPALPAPAKIATLTPVKPLEGKISVVNKEYNFAVFNLGSRDGILLGDKFSLMRGTKVMGTLTVEKVHDSMSAAGFGAELKDIIRENDVVQKVK